MNSHMKSLETNQIWDTHMSEEETLKLIQLAILNIGLMKEQESNLLARDLIDHIRNLVAH